MSLLRTADFRKYSTFCFKINGISIYWKTRWARKDAYRFVLICKGEQVGTPSEELLQAVSDACHTPNHNTGKYIESLSTRQKKRLKKALAIHDCDATISDLNRYL